MKELSLPFKALLRGINFYYVSNCRELIVLFFKLLIRTQSDSTSFSSSSSSSSLNSNSIVFPKQTNIAQQHTDSCEHETTDDEDMNNVNDSSKGAKAFIGSRFSKSSQERERMLAKRKEELLKTARKNFLTKQRRPALNSQPSTSSDGIN
jgi:hypothetical protein